MGTRKEVSGAGPEVLRQLGEMAITSEILVGSGALGEILQRLAHRARDVTGADFAAISTFDERGTLTRFIYTGMSEDQARRLGGPPTGAGGPGGVGRRDRA